MVGNGGREHALAWKLLQSQHIRQVICIPGNGGTATTERRQNVSLRVDDFEGMARFALVQNVTLVVVGPELPLSLGITDYFQQHNPNLMVFGPTQEGAQIESSKYWAKSLMQEAGIPTPRCEIFTNAHRQRNRAGKDHAYFAAQCDHIGFWIKNIFVVDQNAPIRCFDLGQVIEAVQAAQ